MTEGPSRRAALQYSVTSMAVKFITFDLDIGLKMPAYNFCKGAVYVCVCVCVCVCVKHKTNLMQLLDLYPQASRRKYFTLSVGITC